LKFGLAKFLLMFLAIIVFTLAVGIASVPGAIVLGMSRDNTVLFIVGAILMLLPVVLTLSMSFFWAELLIGGKGIFSSLSGSHKLIWKGFSGGSWWRVFLLYVITIVIAVVVSLLGELLGALGMMAEPISGMAIRMLISSIVSVFLVTPLMQSIFLSMYYDLKVRSSGSDLSARLDV